MRRKIEERLLEWKARDRMPLLLYGARQVGKTYILSEFGKRHFENVAYINLEANTLVSKYFDDDISPERLIRFLETVVGEKIEAGKTLIILDEIQSSERALSSLKYFCEQAPEYHVAAAGSLLGVAVNREKYSFPVGKVESTTLGPLDFEEFLWALGEDLLAIAIRDCYQDIIPLPKALHRKATELYRIYLIVGGMPACVKSLVDGESLVMLPNKQSEIISNYTADMAKYASAADTVKIRACYNSVPVQLAKENKKFQYKIVQKGGSNTLFGASIEWLVQAGVVLKCQRLDQAIIPIAVYEDLTAFKLYMSDVGLLVMRTEMPQQSILSGTSNIFMGAIAENYIAQSLVANGYALRYWTSEYSAEVDFVIQKGDELIGIEVKRGLHTKSKSLDVFAKKYHPSLCVRFSEKNIGKVEKLLSLPHYAAYCV